MTLENRLQKTGKQKTDLTLNDFRQNYLIANAFRQSDFRQNAYMK